MLDDPGVVAPGRDAGMISTVRPPSTARVDGWPDLATHPIDALAAAPGPGVTATAEPADHRR